MTTYIWVLFLDQLWLSLSFNWCILIYVLRPLTFKVIDEARFIPTILATVYHLPLFLLLFSTLMPFVVLMEHFVWFHFLFYSFINYTLKNFKKITKVLLLYADAYSLYLISFCVLWSQVMSILLLYLTLWEFYGPKSEILNVVFVCFCYDTRGSANYLGLFEPSWVLPHTVIHFHHRTGMDTYTLARLSFQVNLLSTTSSLGFNI